MNAGSACFTTAQFGAPSNFIGSLGRNAFRGPGYFNTDLSLRKNFKLNERLNLQIGANAYNVLNHPSAFAAAAVDARIVQVTGKITF